MEAYLRNKLQVEIADALKQCIKGLTNPDEPAYIAALVNQITSRHISMEEPLTDMEEKRNTQTIKKVLEYVSVKSEAKVLNPISEL